ncbi:MAG: hypothetical protein SWJ54_02185 [Cyanobacteriota bacterium]|nr:hypothetical protein [Cyanobacteriota bacterium]
MDITTSTKQLNEDVQKLKSKYSDSTSSLFIDFYCQYKEGCDYLFPPTVRESIRLYDILVCFLDCIEKGSTNLLVQMMWKDVIGPTLGEYRQDEQTEEKLLNAFVNGELKNPIESWDRESQPGGGVSLILRDLLNDITEIEQQHQSQS